MKKWIIIGIVLLVIAGAYFVFINPRRQMLANAQQTVWETQPLEAGHLESTIRATGRVRSAQHATLNWQTSGAIESVKAAVGTEVQPGDVLAELQQTSLPQTVILAQADLVSAQQALEDLDIQAASARVKAMQDIATYQQALKDAQYQLDNFTVPSKQADLGTVEALNLMTERLEAARQAFEPYKHFAQSNGTRQNLKADLDEAQSDYNAAVKRLEYEYKVEVAQANLDRAFQDYQKWQNGPQPAEVEAAQARIAAAQATLDQARLTAPFAGVVTLAEPQPGDQVAPGTLAFRIDDLEHMFVDLRVSEIDINQVQAGQDVSVTFDALRGKEYHGQVREVGLISDETGNTVNFTVRVELTDADQSVRPGMTSEVAIVVAQREEALLVPNQAIRTENGRQVVYILKPGAANQPPTLEPVEVSLGIASEIYSELLDGDLKAGDPIVLNPTFEEDQRRANPFEAREGPGGEEREGPPPGMGGDRRPANENSTGTGSAGPGAGGSQP